MAQPIIKCSLHTGRCESPESERQYRNTVRQRRALTKALDELTAKNSHLLELADTEDGDQSVLRFRIERAALTGYISDLDTQIRDHEALHTCDVARTCYHAIATVKGPSGVWRQVCQPYLDNWFDNADDDPELEPHDIIMLNGRMRCGCHSWEHELYGNVCPRMVD